MVTTLDGHQMAKQGRAGPALAIAAIGSFFAGCVSTVLVAALGAPLTALALIFGPAEYFSLMVLGLVFAVVLAKGSVLEGDRDDPARAVALHASAPTSRPASRAWRSTSRSLPTASASSSSPWACSATPRSCATWSSTESRDDRAGQDHRPDADDRRTSRIRRAAIARGTLLGSILGILPGGGAVIAAFAAYTFEKKMSKHPERFGSGAIEGVAAPESANNAAAQTSFIPLLTLGIPPNAVMALMVGAMTIHGIVPGPQVMTKQPELFWGLIASMWIGNLMLVVINLPLVGLWVALLRVPYRMLFPAILIFCAIGVYSINNAPADVVMVAMFGLVGYWLVKHDFEPAPMLLGFVLGPLMEENLRRAMLIARGDPTTFLPGRSPACCSRSPLSCSSSRCCR